MVGKDVDLPQRAFVLVVLEQHTARGVFFQSALVVLQSLFQHTSATFVVFHDRLVRLFLINVKD